MRCLGMFSRDTKALTPLKSARSSLARAPCPSVTTVESALTSSVRRNLFRFCTYINPGGGGTPLPFVFFSLGSRLSGRSPAHPQFTTREERSDMSPKQAQKQAPLSCSFQEVGMKHLQRLIPAFLIACTVFAPALIIGAQAQDIPADYQGVLKYLDRKGDFSAQV